MKVLACNIGSTSLKYRLYNLGNTETELASGYFEGVGRPVWKSRHKSIDGQMVYEESPALNHGVAIEQMLRFFTTSNALLVNQFPDCVAFKTASALGCTGVQELNEDVLLAMEAYNTLLPAHNPPTVSAVRHFARLMPSVPLIGIFETGFFRDMKPEAFLYSLPADLSAKGIRRNGAHGASHEYVARWVTEKEGNKDLRLVSCHLGGSSSIAAIKDGIGVDTTLGMSLQTGLMHNNRIGDIDPYLTFYLNETLGYSLDEIKTIYASQSGFLGMSGGFSSDLREIEVAAQAGNELAQATIESFCYQIRKYIGSFTAALGGLDVVTFTGGIGQNSITTRSNVLSKLEFFGIQLDETRNTASVPDSLISGDNSRVRVYLVATNEEIIIARKAKYFLEHKRKGN